MTTHNVDVEFTGLRYQGNRSLAITGKREDVRAWLLDIWDSDTGTVDEHMNGLGEFLQNGDFRVEVDVYEEDHDEIPSQKREGPPC